MCKEREREREREREDDIVKRRVEAEMRGIFVNQIENQQSTGNIRTISKNTWKRKLRLKS